MNMAGKGNRLLWQQLAWAFLLSAIITAATALSYNRNAFQWLDHLFYDLHLKSVSNTTRPPKIVLVLMDEKSSVELQRKRGAWSRMQLAAALHNLCNANAEIVGLDMILSVPDPEPDVDNTLAKVIYNCNNVVLGRASSSKGVSDIPPLPIFQEGMIGDGFLDVAQDEDEVLRRIRFLNAKPLEDGGLMLLPSFALEVARTYLNIEFEFDFSKKDHFLMGGKDDQQVTLPYPELLINYSGNYDNFSRLSYADVVKNRFQPETVAGKIVLVGSSLTIQKDFFVTPITRFSKSAGDYTGKFGKVVQEVKLQKDVGVSCHAYAVNTILSQSFISRANAMVLLAAILVAGLGSLIFYLPGVRILWGTLILLFALASFSYASHIAFTGRMLWVDIAPVVVLLIIQFVTGTTVQRYFEKRRTQMVTNLFGKYLSPAVVDKLVSDDITSTLEGHSREVTIFFSDIRSFTSISEKLGAKDTGILLNTYFDAMIPIIFDNSGTLDKLIGDAVMAFFGAPVHFEDHPDKAADASLAMLDILDELRKRKLKGMENVNIGIGLNTGEVTIGNLGSEKFMDYTVIGDSVNLASRLEGLNKVYGTRILISEFTAGLLNDRFVCRELDRVVVKGKDEAVAIYELAGLMNSLDLEYKQAMQKFESGLLYYREMKWGQAEEVFGEVLKQYPGDGPSNLYLERISRLRHNPPPADWNGVTQFDSK